MSDIPYRVRNRRKDLGTSVNKQKGDHPELRGREGCFRNGHMLDGGVQGIYFGR